MFKIIVCCALLCLSKTASIERSLIITTSSGAVKGKLNDFNGIEFYSYQGIPYAENPTGKLRFRPPVPRKPWTNVLDATGKGAICLQLPRFHYKNETTEDCLIINVYVPKNGTDKPLPIMVFVHGGALQFQSGHIEYIYGPQFILSREIIYVSMNYRLGPFGFLSLDIEEASGNAGLKDVLLSLKWVKQNIKNFGGDPDMVTIAGHSAGSVIVNYLMMTNQSDGLFTQAILMSGSALSPRFYTKYPTEISHILAKELDIQTDDTYETLEELQNIDPFKIIDAYYNMSMTHDSPLRLYAPFVPSKEVEYNHALFSENPMGVFRRKSEIYQKVPVLVGLTAQEAISMIPHVLKNSDGVNKIRENPEHLIPSNIEYPIGSQRSKKLAKLISEMYFGDDMQNFTLTSLIELMSDSQYIYGVHFWIDKYKNMADSNSLYLYIFDFIGNLNMNNILFKAEVNGTGHGDDVKYIFVTNATKSMYNSIDEKSRRMKDRMIDFVSNFVYYGNPAPTNHNNPYHWPDYGKERNYLLLNENPSIQTFNTSQLYPKMEFWAKVYDEYYVYIENGGEIQRKIIP